MRSLLTLPILAGLIATPGLRAAPLPGSVYLLSGNENPYDFRCAAGGRLDRFRAETLEYLGSVDVPGGACGRAEWSPDGRLFVMGSSGVAAIDPATGATLLSLPGLPHAGFALGPDGTVYDSTYDSGAGAGLAAYDGTTGERLWWRSYGDQNLQPVDVAVNLSGGRVAVALDGLNPSVRVYDFSTHGAASVPIYSSLPGANAEVGAIAFVRDGLVMAGDPNCDAIYLVDANPPPAVLAETVQYGRDSGAADMRMVWDSAGNGGLAADGHRLLFYDLTGTDSRVLVDAGEASMRGVALAPGGSGWLAVSPWYTHDVRIDRIDGATLAIATNAAAVTIPDTLGLPGVGLVYGDSAPEIDAPPELTVERGATVSFTVTVADPDRDPVALSTDGLPAGATLDLPSGVFSWTPDRDGLGDHAVVFRATTAGRDAASTTTIHVVDSVMETVRGGCACDFAPRNGGGGPLALIALLAPIALLARRRTTC